MLDYLSFKKPYPAQLNSFTL